MKFNKIYFLIAIPLVFIAIALIMLITNKETENKIIITGIVETTDVDVASKIAGRIDSVFVSEGDFVHKGQVLARLESKEMDAKVEQTRGLMEAAKSKYEMSLNGARKEEKEATEKLYLQAQHQFELAEKTWSRMKKMYDEKLISSQERDQYEFQYKAAMEQMLAAKAKYELVMNGARTEEIMMAQSMYYQAQNGFREALAYQQELTLVSPINGELQKRLVDPGEIISSGYPIFTILDLKDSWVVIQLKEDQMSKIKKGDTFRGKITALGNQEYDFTVSYISPIGDFANWKPTNQKGEFDIRTFEIRLRPKNPIEGLRPGMTVNIVLN